MKSSPGTSELKEGAQEWSKFYQRLWQKRLSRRKVFKVSAMLALVGSGSISQFLAACGEEEKRAAETGTPSAGTGTPFAGVTGDWDTTGTPPYKQGLPDGVAKIDERWKQYPWYYKYGWPRYNWDIPVYRGGHFIVPYGPPANYDLMISATSARSTNDGLYTVAVREGAQALGPTIEPLLAIKDEHNEDFTSWTITIPENVKWHNIAPVNGRLMTAEDVAFSYQRYADTSVNKAALRMVDKITAVDKTHVRFDLKQPVLDMQSVLGFANFVVFAPEHFQNQDLFKAKAIGTGPFMLESSEFQNKAEHVRNPDYWRMPPFKPEKYGNRPLPLADRMTKQYFANNLSAKEAFFAGAIDTFAPGCGLDTALTKEQLKQIPNALIMVTPYYICCPFSFLFQYKNPLFQDIRVRRAMSMALDREQIWRDATDRGSAITAHPVSLDFMGSEFPLELKDFGANAQFNLQLAKQLMREAGYQDPVKLKVYQSPNQPAMWQAVLDTAVFQWKQAGIADVEVVVRDTQLFTQDRVSKTFPDLYYYCCVLPNGAYTLDSTLSPLLLTDSPGNFGSVSDPVLDDLLNKYTLNTDPNAATKVARDIGDRIVENVDHLWVGWIPGQEVAQPWAHGLVLSTRSCHHGFAQYNYSYVWIDPTAPGDRGGKPV